MSRTIAHQGDSWTVRNSFEPGLAGHKTAGIADRGMRHEMWQRSFDFEGFGDVLVKARGRHTALCDS